VPSRTDDCEGLSKEVTVGTITRLSQVKDALKSASANEPWKASFLITRLALRTGVNLSAIRPEQEDDPALIEQALSGLSAMGFNIEKH
jgi:hypothetical protein